MAAAVAAFAVMATVVTATAAGGAAIEDPRNATESPSVRIVDDDGDADYRSLAPAVADSGDGDTVRVRPGTYAGDVVLAANVTVSAPDGAVIAASVTDGDEQAFSVPDGSDAAPVVSGFTVVGFETGVAASDTSGDWVVRNATFRSQRHVAIRASSSSGDWHVEDVRIRNASGRGVASRRSTGDWRVTNASIETVTDGVDAGSSTGDWVVEDTRIYRVRHGVVAEGTSGAWTLRNVTVDTDADVEVDEDEGVIFSGVAARSSTGDWRIENSTIRDAISGVSAWQSSGDWTIVDSLFQNLTASERYDFFQPPLPEGVAVFAGETNGSWQVRGTTMVDVSGAAIDASGASPAGTAVGPGLGDLDDPNTCVGNVECRVRPKTPTASPAATDTPSDSRTAGSPTVGTRSPAGGTRSPGSATQPGSPATRPTAGGSTGTADPGGAPASPTTADGSLSAGPAVLALLLCGFGLARRRENS